MGIVVIPANELSEDLLARWAEIQQRNPGLFSPFFRPEFTQAVSRVRDDIFVAVIDGGAAFFPFQRAFLGGGRPVGGSVSDYHGLISEPGYRVDPVRLIKDSGLRSWTFDHVPAEHTIFAPWRTFDTGSPVVDIGHGAPNGSTAMYSDHRRKRRRLERDFGHIEVELETTDPSILEFCIRSKSQQYRKTKMPDVFASSWARSLVNVIAAQHRPEFGGVLSVLRAGGQPVAAHFGMRSGNVWHYWFPAYDPQFQRYSPGMLLLLEMIAGAPKLGINMIDLGKGEEDYKFRVSNRQVQLIEGSVVRNPFSFHLCKGLSRLKSAAKKTQPVKDILTPAYRFYQGIKLRIHWVAMTGAYAAACEYLHA